MSSSQVTTRGTAKGARRFRGRRTGRFPIVIDSSGFREGNASEVGVFPGSQSVGPGGLLRAAPWQPARSRRSPRLTGCREPGDRFKRLLSMSDRPLQGRPERVSGGHDHELA